MASDLPRDAEGRILVAALRIRGAGRLAEIIRHGFGQVSVRLLSRVYRDEEFVVDDLVIMESDDATRVFLRGRSEEGGRPQRAGGCGAPRATVM